MRSTFDNYDEFDDQIVDDFLATRHIIRGNQRHAGKKRGRKRFGKMHDPRWENSDWSRFVDYEDYDEDEFDSFYDRRYRKYGH